MRVVGSRTECCGETDAHFAKAYEVNGALHLHSESGIVQAKRREDRHFEYWSDSISPETSVKLLCFYESGEIYFIEDTGGNEIRLSELDAFDQAQIAKELVLNLSADEQDKYRPTRAVQPNDIDPPGTYESDYYKESK